LLPQSIEGHSHIEKSEVYLYKCWMCVWFCSVSQEPLPRAKRRRVFSRHWRILVYPVER